MIITNLDFEEFFPDSSKVFGSARVSRSQARDVAWTSPSGIITSRIISNSSAEGFGLLDASIVDNLVVTVGPTSATSYSTLSALATTPG